MSDESLPASIGNVALFHERKLALLCSRACPGSIIVKTLDVVRALRDTSWTIVGGFQSPTEQECLEIVLRGERPVIVCPARCVEGMRVPSSWKPHIGAGRMLIVAPFDSKARRATAALAEERNRYVISLADAVFIPHAAPGGTLDRLYREQRAGKKPLWTIDDRANAHLISLGAIPLPSDSEALLQVLTAECHSCNDWLSPPRSCPTGLSPNRASRAPRPC